MINLRPGLALLLAVAGCDAVFGLDHLDPYQPIDAAIDAPIEIGWKATAAGYTHSCGIRADDTLWCWGNNVASEIGIGSSSGVVDEPVRVGTELFSQVSTTSQHTCAIALDGGMWCWGANYYSQLGTGNVNVSAIPERLDGTWRQVSAGLYHTCAIREDSTLWCWGYNYYGQVGTGAVQPPVPEQVGTATWLDVDAGVYHTCGVQTDQSLWCWGYNGYGEFGNTTNTSSASPTLSSGEAWVDVDAGRYTTCGRTAQGALRCWGDGTRGQLGTGMSVSALSPQPVVIDGVEPEDWVQISIDDAHACGVRADGSLWCWGAATHAQIGAEPAAGESNVPVRMTQGSETWRRVDTGTNHTCAIDTDNRAWCFGAASRAQLGTDDHAHSVPAPMPGAYSQLAANGLATCGLQAGTTVPHCAGYNEYGQLGDGTKSDRQVMTPIKANLTGYTTVALGASHGCATTATTTLCWGDNTYGQLGDGSVTSREAPSSILGYVSTVTAGNHTCGLSSGFVYCWGYNVFGQLGNLTTISTPFPTPIINGGVVQIAAGAQHTCAINTSGTAACWGRNYEGEVGNGTATTMITAPTNVIATTTGPFASIAAAGYHTCGIATDNKLWCWGYNLSGQLGQGDRTARVVPIRVGAGLWRRVALGGSHTCAIAMDGSLWCWGANMRGQLGLGTFVDRYVPGRVGTEVDWVDVVAGDEHTCAAKAGGVTWCWGSNDYGQIFDGTAWVSAPVMVP